MNSNEFDNEEITTDESYYDRIRKKQQEEKPVRKFRKRDLLFILVAVLLVAGALIFSRKFTEEKSWQTVAKGGKQYYRSAESVISADTRLKTDDSGRVVSENAVEKIATVPIYFDEEPAFMLTEAMVYYDPNSYALLRADPMTEFYVKDDGTVRAVKGGVSKNLAKGFLYNGSDMFILLEPMVLKLNGYTIDLPALSYIEAVKDDPIAVFNYETKETEEFVPETEVEVSSPDGVYSLLCMDDAYIRPDGKRLLLFFAPDKLDPLI